MESNESDIAWWRADAHAVARAISGGVRSITRADVIFTGYVLALWAVGLFVWPAIPMMGLTFLPLAVRLFIWPESEARSVKERMAKGDDRYFEEQRALRAYAITEAPHLRRHAAFGIVVCLVLSVLEVYGRHLHHS